MVLIASGMWDGALPSRWRLPMPGEIGGNVNEFGSDWPRQKLLCYDVRYFVQP